VNWAILQHWGRCHYRLFAANFKSILVAMELWTGAQRVFAVKPFYKNGDNFVIAQCAFRREFGIHRNRAVPPAHAIKTWVRNFENTSSTLKKKGGSVKTVRTPKNIAVVREAIERSPHHSARRHSVSLGLSEASVQWILLSHCMCYIMPIILLNLCHKCAHMKQVVGFGLFWESYLFPVSYKNKNYF
jgi:hypothetical protein